MSLRDEGLIAGVALTQRALWHLRLQPMASWVDSNTGGYCVGRAMRLTFDPPSVLVQHWHSKAVEILGKAGAATLRPYPAEPIPEPEVK